MAAAREKLQKYLKKMEDKVEHIRTVTQIGLPLGVDREMQFNYLVELHELEQDLIRTGNEFAAKPGTTNETTETKLKKFKKWLIDNGVSEDLPFEFKIGLREGIGCVATRDIKEGEELIKIPRTLMMDVSTAEESTRMKTFIDWLPRLNVRILLEHVLQIHLLEQKHAPGSFYQPYIALLPQSYPLPWLVDPQEYKDMSNTTLLPMMVEQKRANLRSFADIFQAVANSKVIPLQNFTYTEWIWAASTLHTRKNFVIRPGSTANKKDESPRRPQRVMALVPGWDFFNHQEGLPITTEGNDKDGSLLCAAPQSYKQGQQVYIGYTEKRSNRMRFLFSGFLSPYATEDDDLMISFTFPKVKDVKSRRDLAARKFKAREPFPQYIQPPLEKSIDNLGGIMACALGTAADFEAIQNMCVDLADDMSQADMRKSLAENVSECRKMFSRGLARLKSGSGNGNGNSTDYAFECTRRILDWVKIQALMQKRRLAELADADAALVQSLGSGDKPLNTKDQFKLNMAHYCETERQVCDILLKEVEMYTGSA